MGAHNLPAVAELAARFSSVLREWLTDDEMREVIARNAAEPSDLVCHSHDFCDANMAMLEAWESFGLDFGMLDFEAENDECVSLWNAAATLAKKNAFQVGE